MRALKLLIAMVLLATAAGIAHAALTGAAGGADARGGSGRALRISGSVDGLYPGAAISFPVRVTNRRRQPVRLRFVRARVRDASSTCDAEFLRVRSSRRRARIRPRSTRRVRLRATLAPATPDACQRASFPLRFRARAVVLR